MAILPIRKFPDPVLKEKVRPVETIDDELHKLIKNMIDTMYAAPGMGLAANQVGVLKSVIVVEVDEKLMVFINPEITWMSEETDDMEEGCLSVGAKVIYMMVSRADKIHFKALDQDGKPVEFDAEGLKARVLQHEVDHLNGILILDRTTAEEKKRVLKEITRSVPLL
ncbi:MAG TPA: peptide deformylase [Candidatus Aquicultor sp.]